MLYFIRFLYEMGQCSYFTGTDNFLHVQSLFSTTVHEDNVLDNVLKFSRRDFFSKYDQIWSQLRTWSHLLKTSLMENFIFCAVPGKSFI